MARAPAAVEPRGPPVRGAGQVVLVVDDDALVRRSTARVLVQHGFQVREATSAADAEAALAREGADVVLLDRSMPGGSGAGAVPRLLAARPTARVLFFTGDDVPEAELAAAHGLVQKPVTGDALAEAVLRALADAPPR